jgi:hypothetical protein
MKEFGDHHYRHARESGHPEIFEFPGFRLALAIASSAGMTSELFNGFWKHHTRVNINNKDN